MAIGCPKVDDLFDEGVDNSVFKVSSFKLLRNTVEMQAPGELCHVGLFGEDQASVQKLCINSKILNGDIGEIDGFIVLRDRALSIYQSGELVGTAAQGMGVKQKCLAPRFDTDVYGYDTREVAATVSSVCVKVLTLYLGPADASRRTLREGSSDARSELSIMIAGFELNLSTTKWHRRDVCSDLEV